jgi:hypothetical protein
MAQSSEDVGRMLLFRLNNPRILLVFLSPKMKAL